MIELKPCPFCGGQTHVYTTVNGRTRKLYIVECLECSARTLCSLDELDDTSYREGKIEAFKIMDRYLYVIAESCDLVTSRDFNTINAMRMFIKNNLRRLGEIE